MPLLMPPLIPPLWFVRVRTVSPSMKKASFAALPRSSDRPKPAPNSTPLTAGIENSPWASSPSSVSNQGSPTPAGRPRTAVSSTPPTLSPSPAAASMAVRMASPAAGSRTAKASFSSKAKSAFQSAPKARSAIPAQRATWVPIQIPRVRRAWIQTAPAATSAAVTRPEKWPPPR